MLSNNLYQKFKIKILREKSSFTYDIEKIENNKIYVLKNNDCNHLIFKDSFKLIFLKKHFFKNKSFNLSAVSSLDNEKYIEILLRRKDFEKIWDFIVNNSNTEAIEKIYLNNFLSSDQNDKSIDSLLTDMTKNEFLTLAKEFLDLEDLVIISNNKDKLLYSKDLINHDSQTIKNEKIYFKSVEGQTIDPNKLDLFFQLFESHYQKLSTEDKS